MIIRPKYKALIFVCLILLAAGVVRMFSTEDNWICQNGQWIAHGKPADPMPKSGCGNQGNQNQNPPVGAANENIINLNIKENQEITSPLTVTGEAKGTWFFEASFPVILTDWDGKIIAQGIAKAKGDWMTENFVPFEANLQFVKPGYKNTGSLILKKDNPSGLPQNDAAVEIPVLFK
jgi:hypothetical protein